MSPFSVLICDRFDLNAQVLLRGTSGLKVRTAAGLQPTSQELLDVEGLIIRSRTKVDAALLDAAPKLKFIVTATSGFDHIDFDLAKSRGVTVAFTPGANAASACELTWSLLLACARQVPAAFRNVKSGEWRKDELTGRELSKKTLGIVGLGRIGTRVAKVAHAFGMQVLAFDPYVEPEVFTAHHAQRVSFEEIVKLADALTFHVPATPETRFMLTQQNLESMPRHGIVVNASRGSIVREQDLVQALTAGWIACAGLDVYEKEPLPRDSRLLAMPNVVLTPHIGAFTFEAFEAASHEAAEKMAAFAAHGPSVIGDQLPPTAPWYQAEFYARSSKKPSEGYT